MKKLAISTIAALFVPAIVTLPATAQPAQSNQPGPVQHAIAAKLEMDTVPNLDPNGIRQVQEALNKKGFEAGPIDGILGPQTKEAVRKFQDAYGIKASGQIDNQTLYALGKAALAGLSKP